MYSSLMYMYMYMQYPYLNVPGSDPVGRVVPGTRVPGWFEILEQTLQATLKYTAVSNSCADRCRSGEMYGLLSLTTRATGTTATMQSDTVTVCTLPILGREVLK